MDKEDYYNNFSHLYEDRDSAYADYTEEKRKRDAVIALGTATTSSVATKAAVAMKARISKLESKKDKTPEDLIKLKKWTKIYRGLLATGGVGLTLTAAQLIRINKKSNNKK